MSKNTTIDSTSFTHCDKAKFYYDVDPVTFAISNNKDKFLPLGHAILDDKGCKLSGTVDCLSFKVDCSGDISIDYSATNITTSAGYGIYLTVYVDGVRQSTRFHINDKGGTLKIASDLAKGIHDVKIYRQTEYKGSLTTPSNILHINSVTVGFGGKLYTPEKNSFTIEFIGDSITAGYGSYANTTFNPQDGEAPCYQDGTNTYAFLTAEALNADITVTAFSGCGIVKGFEQFTMPQIYKHYPNVETQENFVYTDEPEIVVINLGTNDAWNGVSASSYVEGAVEFGKSVRSIHPDAKIVFIGGMMMSGFNSKFAEIAETLGGEAAGFYSWYTESICSGHPVEEEHAALAVELTEFLRTIM